MRGILGSTLAALAIVGSVQMAQAQTTGAQTADPIVEFAFMPSMATVTLLNDGGKYVAIDLKHIAQGGSCRMDKDATIARVGAGGTAGFTRVRYAGVQVSAGGCPFMTSFDMADADYAKGRAAFVALKQDAETKVEKLKKELGEKWNELIGKKSS